MKNAHTMGLDGKLVKHEIEETGDGEFVEKMGRGKKIAIAALFATMAGAGIWAYFSPKSPEPTQPRTEYRENQSYQPGQEYSAKK